MPFFSFVKLQQHAALVLSDSGTVQEEACILGVPNITIREVTERPETVEAGSNFVTGTNPDAIVAAARMLQAQNGAATWTPPREYLVPNVAEAVVRILLSVIPPAAR
jgi:UDP-N-acetylglucosamine 2-epimerase (non-hydrolysing)